MTIKTDSLDLYAKDAATGGLFRGANGTAQGSRAIARSPVPVEPASGGLFRGVSKSLGKSRAVARNPPPEEPGANAEEKWINLQQLVDRCLGNLALADRLIATFSQGLDEAVVQLQIAIEEQDMKTTALLAHRLKGEAANLGSQRLHRHAAELEDAARNGHQHDAGALAGTLRAACRLFRENVPSFEELSRHSSPAGRG
jgi:HPt (histidine-containing phosphotransfer) domain-containing protein